MKIMGTLVAGEGRKILAQGKYRLFFAVALSAVAGGALLRAIPGNVVHFVPENYPWTALSFIVSLFAPLGAFMLASDLLAAEFESNRIKILLTRPVGRHSVLLAKAVAIFTYLAALLAGTFVLSCAASFFAGGGVPYGSAPAYAVALLPMAALTSMAVMVAAFSKSGTSCFALCLLAYLGCMGGGFAFASLSPVLFTSWLGLGNMTIGASVPAKAFLQGALLLAGYCSFFLSAAALRFAGREF